MLNSNSFGWHCIIVSYKSIHLVALKLLTQHVVNADGKLQSQGLRCK